MIPWRLQFSGVRDYAPTLIDLSGAKDHIMITGPNGAGKSTITFCIGAVLYSAKVDVDGLKSRNLPVEETWKAKISLLFKNDGVMKIDAPDYVQFTLKIVQDPGQPVKKEYSISTGDTIDDWEEVIPYTSGDRTFNFTAYKRDLQYKYKVDPDLYYLIWYQQEVNQFAVMHPEERFRIFSEMHGIDKVQRDWEESMERVKDTEESVQSAELNVKKLKLELSMKKTALDRYVDNQKRLHEGGKLYIKSLLELESYYKSEIARLEEVVSQLDEEISAENDDSTVTNGFKERDEGQLTFYSAEREQLETKIQEEEQKRNEMTEQMEQIQSRIKKLDEELQTITRKKNQIMRTEEEVKEALENLLKEKEQTNLVFAQKQSEIKVKSKLWQEKIELITKLQHEVQMNEEFASIHVERLKQYQSSYKVQETILRSETSLTENKDRKYKLSRKQRELQEELRLLVEERDLSARQLESMEFFRVQQIQAYPLRELIELEEGARLKDEQLFDAIKYTIFFNGKHVSPPNDLYHVPLMSIIPDRMITKLPSLHLKVKENLQEEELPQAMKALWWVEQFFKDGPFKVQNGMLYDTMGIRGPQEKSRYILSVRALQIRKEEIEQFLDECNTRISAIDKEILDDTNTIRELNSVIHQVQESEAFMTTKRERILVKQKLEEERNAQIKMEDELKLLETEKENLLPLKASQDYLEKVLKEEMEIYLELGKMKDKYEERGSLQRKCDEETTLLKEKTSFIKSLEDDSEELDRNITRIERVIRRWKDHLEDIERKVQLLGKKKKNDSDDKEAAELELVQIIQELVDLKNLVPAIYAETAIETSSKHFPPVSQMRNNREEGKIMFNYARTEPDIDPAAEDNYKTIKLEYERLESEYKRTKILLEQDKERMEKLKEHLETTINMRVLELQKRFKYYMSQFQFEGEISWEPIEDRRSRTHFYLYIKARKEGHRGTMEDVSVKARGGKVGKGVSGGEESLSSLLFALALLQNLQTSPGFIIMDEFDSALDEVRKVKVFDLYVQELKRKLIILTPKSHEPQYLDKFTKAFIVQHDPTIPRSKVTGIVKSVVHH